jgi:hypothetical protein
LARLSDSIIVGDFGTGEIFRASPLPTGDIGRRQIDAVTPYLKSALDFLLPFATGQKVWPYPHIVLKPDGRLLLPALRLGYWVWASPEYRSAFEQISQAPWGNYSDLDIVLSEPQVFSVLAGDLAAKAPDVPVVPIDQPTETEIVPPPTSSGPGFFAILGIIIAVALILALLALIIVCVLRRKQTSGYQTTFSSTTGALPPGAFDSMPSAPNTPTKSDIPREKMERYLQNPRLQTFAAGDEFNDVELQEAPDLDAWK